MSTTLPPKLELYQQALQQNLEDEEGILSLPNRRRPRDQREVAQEIASAAYPHLTPIQAIIEYDTVVRNAKAVIRDLQLKRQQAHIQSRTLHKPWTGQEKDPLTLDGPPAIPMPVTIPPERDFKPIFDFLKADKDPMAYISGQLQDSDLKVGNELVWNSPQIEFKRGILYDDGRMDLCKMVTGPTHITALMDSLENNTHVKQFLLGNNIIASTGTLRIADFIRKHPDRMETWYLAGSAISSTPFAALASAMTTSSKITNVWLKRNPLSQASVPALFDLITKTANLRTLDLENTELGDVGVTKLFTSLTNQPSSLRNLYLNANGIGVSGSQALSNYLLSPTTHIESLYLAANPIGTAGVKHLAPSLSLHPDLKRLGIQSCGLDTQGITTLCTALTGHPNLQALDLSAALATKQHNQRFNHFDASCVPAIKNLILNTPSLRWLSLGRVAFNPYLLIELHEAIASSNLVFFAATVKNSKTCSLALRQSLEKNLKRLYPEFDGGYEEFRRSLLCRFLISSEDVRLIDSHYRTMDRGKGGYEEDEVVWKKGDETWKLVLEDVAKYV